jgi:hypothetical protein
MAKQPTGNGEKGSSKTFLLAAVGTSLLGVPLGFFTADIVEPAAPETPGMSPVPADVNPASNLPAQEAASNATEILPPVAVELVLLPPIITNISDPPKVWVRLEGQLLFDKNGHDDAAVTSAEMAQHVLTYLRTLKLTDIQGAGAIQAISQDINEIVRSSSDGEVQGLLLSGLVFE